MLFFIVVRERYGDVPLDEEDSSSSSEEEDDEGMVSQVDPGNGLRLYP